MFHQHKNTRYFLYRMSEIYLTRDFRFKYKKKSANDSTLMCSLILDRRNTIINFNFDEYNFTFALTVIFRSSVRTT